MCFHHSHPKCFEHVLCAWQCPTFGGKVQYIPDPNYTTALDAADCKCIQEAIGVLLCYVHAINPTMLVTLDSLATMQAKETQATMEALMHLLNYCTTHPDAIIHFHASNMVLWTHNNAFYFTALKGWLCVRGYSFLSSAHVTSRCH